MVVALDGLGVVLDRLGEVALLEELVALLAFNIGNGGIAVGLLLANGLGLLCLVTLVGLGGDLYVFELGKDVGGAVLGKRLLEEFDGQVEVILLQKRGPHPSKRPIQT